MSMLSMSKRIDPKIQTIQNEFYDDFKQENNAIQVKFIKIPEGINYKGK